MGDKNIDGGLNGRVMCLKWWREEVCKVWGRGKERERFDQSLKSKNLSKMQFFAGLCLVAPASPHLAPASGGRDFLAAIRTTSRPLPPDSRPLAARKSKSAFFDLFDEIIN
ncbi:hypothetical protein M5689_011046 [Euphorbia peplus]|nr:hypothetical protein M5689_011046 [Euphorbia peplus]